MINASLLLPMEKWIEWIFILECAFISYLYLHIANVTAVVNLYRSSSNTYCSPDRTLHFLSHRHLHLSRHPPHKSTLTTLRTPRWLAPCRKLGNAVALRCFP
ncbi:hypothetical protein E2C01_016314 [Portunus trituberculatus]|uniref:Uncharacterized protein n=1 Tax=Portunus trituberculatus TaxID=210409 RepID=A0A5B7DQF8_PORTR|nr:hypothetical protein [Portunus trituberculatus]